MTRVLSSACAVLLVLCLGGRASAGGKPPIAILGLEVYDAGSGIDPDSTKAARELTTALRDRAKAGTGPYAPVQGGDKAGEKELIDEKLLNNCDTEAYTCMAAIGSELGAEVLMYGRIWFEKSGQSGQGTYKVSIKLLNVGLKQLASSMVETLPIAESTGVRASAHAKVWYAKLVGGVTGGTLAVKANIDRGTVLLDDDTKGNLTSGVLTLTGLPEGRHTLAIEAQGYQRYEATITIRKGDTTQQNVTMVELSRKVSGGRSTGARISLEGTVDNKDTRDTKSKTNVWKPVFYGTVLLGAGAGAYTLWQFTKQQKAADNLHTGDSDHCGDATSGDFKAACDAHGKVLIGWAVTGVFGAAAIASFYMAYLRSDSESDTKSVTRGHRKRREVAITPIIMPNGGGATLQFDW
jgi:hypothetical protein